MKHLSIKNWNDYQHYSNRSPIWIKFYNTLLDDYLFTSLPDTTKSHLLMIWLLASRNDNCLPFDEKWIRQRISADGEVDLQCLIDKGFLLVIELEADQITKAETPATEPDMPPESCDTEPASKSLAGTASTRREEKIRKDKEQELRLGVNNKHLTNTQDSYVPSTEETPKTPYSPEFEQWWSQYPPREGKKGNKQKSYGYYKSRLKDGETHDSLLAALMRYGHYSYQKNQLDTEYVMMTTTFLNDPDNIKNQWTVNHEASKRRSGAMSAVEQVEQANRRAELAEGGQHSFEAEAPFSGTTYEHDQRESYPQAVFGDDPLVREDLDE